MDKDTVVHIYNEILLSHKKEPIWVNSNEVDEPRAYYYYYYMKPIIIKQSKSEREI